MSAARSSADVESLPNIADDGMMAHTRTAALVTSNGEIDWMCVPRFDGNPIIGTLIGGAAAGTLRLGPTGTAKVVARRYRTAPATLKPIWETPQGRLTLTEGMVADVTGRLSPSTLLVRRLTAEGGPVAPVLRFHPRLGEAHQAPRTEIRDEVVVCTWATTAVALWCTPSVPLSMAAPTALTVVPGVPFTVSLGGADREPLVYVRPDVAWAALKTDEEAWRTWCDEVDHDLPFRDVVVRSLVTLRLLTYSPSGAPVAAPTTSLPEVPGGVRNRDYRYAWPRDASIGIGAFLGVGKVEKAQHFLAWLLHASRLDRLRLPVLLGLNGRRSSPKRALAGWPGYASSRPVRVGSGAATQHQLDGYGWVVDAAWFLTRADCRLTSETWRAMRGFANQVASRWRDPDAGIWEIRDDAAHHVHSKVMAWVALDRALRIAATQRTPTRDVARWPTERQAIAAEVSAAGFKPDLGTYTRTYGSADVDAAMLILPFLDLEPRGSQRVRSTIEAIRRRLSAGGPLLHRYPPGDDGLPGQEGAFVPCSFWLVQTLASTGSSARAERLFAELLERMNPLALLPEEMDPATNAYLGNYPQALSHAALVQPALALRDARASTVATASHPRRTHHHKSIHDMAADQRQ